MKRPGTSTISVSGTAALCSLALALGACSDSPGTEGNASANTGTDDAGEDGTAAASWTATADSLGPISVDTPFDRSTIAGLLPDFAVSLGAIEIEGSRSPIIEARRGTGPTDIVLFDEGAEQRIGSARVMQPGLIANAAPIGETFLMSGLDYNECFPGAEMTSGDVVCVDPDTPSLVYWIRGEWDAPAGRMPSEAQLAGGQIYTIVWRPPQ